MPRVTIRTALPEDYQALCRLWREIDLLHARVRPDYFCAAEGAPRTRRYLEQGIMGAHSAVLVAELEGEEPCGLMELKLFETPADPQMVPARRVYVEQLVVASSHRRRGIGRVLMEAAAKWARREQASQLLLTVWAGNQEAEAFYASLGYLPISQVLGLPL